MLKILQPLLSCQSNGFLSRMGDDGGDDNDGYVFVIVFQTLSTFAFDPNLNVFFFGTTNFVGFFQSAYK